MTDPPYSHSLWGNPRSALLPPADKCWLRLWLHKACTVFAMSNEPACCSHCQSDIHVSKMWLLMFLCGRKIDDEELYLSSLACQHRCQGGKFAMTLLECVRLHPIFSLCFCGCCPVSTGAFCQLQSSGNVLLCHFWGKCWDHDFA